MAKNNVELMAKAQAPRTTAGQWVDDLRQMLVDRMPAITASLPGGLRSDRFQNVALIYLVKNAGELSKCTKLSLVESLMHVAQQGLDLSIPNEVSIVRFGDKATMMRGYKGYRKLALRDPDLLNIKAEPVYANDLFRVLKGSDARVIHEPVVFGDRGELIGFYAIAYFQNGMTSSTEMGLEEVEKHAKRYIKASGGPFGGVKTNGRKDENFEAYGLKTALIRLCWRDLNLHAEMAEELTREFEGPEPTFVAEAARPAVSNGGTWPAITADQAAAALEAEELPPPDAPDAEDYA